MSRTVRFVVCFCLCLCSTSVWAVELTFNAPAPGTIADSNGLGTGFTNRLPGTGSAIAVNDPKLSLLARPGYLQINASTGNIGGFGGGVDLPNADTPGLFLDDATNNDLTITAKFDDVDVPNHQFAIYIGTRSDRSIRAGFHGPYQIYLAANEGGAPDFGWNSGLNAFAAGDDLIIALRRRSGLWSVNWTNLTNPPASGDSTTSGSGPGAVAFPQLNSETDLYAGLIHSATTTQTGYVDYFRAEVVPEPSTAALAVVGIIALIWGVRRRLPLKNREDRHST